MDLICMPGFPVLHETEQPDQRSLENPSVSINDPDAIAEAFGWALPTDSGQAVNPGRALSLSTFWAAVKMISGDVSRLPMQTFRRRPNGLRPIADDSHQLWPMIQPLGMANPEVSVLKLWRRAMVHALVYENAYIWMDTSPAGKVRGMYQLLSDRTMVVRKGGRLWAVTELGDVETGGSRVWARPYEEVIHIEGLCFDGLCGSDLVSAAREDIGVALAARQFKSRFFGQGMHAGGILQAPPGAATTAIQKVEKAITEHHSSSEKAFKTLVLRDGFKWFSTQISPEDAELTQIDETEIRNLCRRFLLQPGRMGLRDSISYNSLEAEKRDYYDTTLSYWASIIRSEINAKALTEDERREWLIDYNVSLALLWADASTLIKVATQGINARDHNNRSIFDADEVRGWFNLPEREERDQPVAAEPKDSPADVVIDDGGTDGDSDEQPQDDQMRAAVRELLTAELRRLIRRLNVETAKAVKRGTMQNWRETCERSGVADVAVESLSPASGIMRASLASDMPPQLMAGALMFAYRNRLAETQFPAGWDEKDWQIELADEFAAEWTRSKA